MPSFLLVRTLLLFLFMVGMNALPAADYEARTYTAKDGTTLPYRLLKPEGYDKTKTYPVILFFHGAGERGDDNQAQIKVVAPTFATPEFQAKNPCFVIAPQCPKDQRWVEMDWGLTSGTRLPQPSAPMQLALGALDSVLAEFSIDKNRVYVAGLSMGGYATWDCVTRFPERFAAAVPVCGGGDEKTVTPAVAKVPLWAFHSSDDGVVPPIRTVHMVAALVEAGGHPRFNLFSDQGHGSWGKAFSDPELYSWLFAQHLAPAEPAPAK